MAAIAGVLHLEDPDSEPDGHPTHEVAPQLPDAMIDLILERFHAVHREQNARAHPHGAQSGIDVPTQIMRDEHTANNPLLPQFEVQQGCGSGCGCA